MSLELENKVKVLEAELDDARDRLNAILSSMNEGLIAFDANFKVMVMNQAMAVILRLAPGAAESVEVGSVLKLYKGDEPVPVREALFDAARTHGIVSTKLSDDYFVEDSSGNRSPVTFSAAILPGRQNSSGVQGIVVVRDVTEDKLVDKAKTEFVSLASHQLRTPITSIRWYSEMLLGNKIGPLNEKQLDYLTEIEKGSARMVTLVNALLNVSRLELGTFVIEPKEVDLESEMRDVVREMAPLVETKKIRVDENFVGVPITTMADTRLLNILLQNLVSNAVKYTAPGGKVSLGLERLAPGATVDDRSFKKAGILISVTDTGFGIPEEAQGRIFTKLFRADNARESDTDGTGLGLYIAKSIVDSVDGQIWFRSKEGVGTSFYVLLPAEGMPARTSGKKLF